MARIVIALGGNALGNTPAEQRARVAAACPALVGLIHQGHEIIVSHGNGPQVGMIQTAFDAAAKTNPAVAPMPLPECTAMSQGYIGYHLQQGLRRALRAQGMPWQVATVVTQVVVDPDDPAFCAPAKPIGAFYDAAAAQRALAYVPMALILISIFFTAVPLSMDSETLSHYLPITVGSLISIAIGEVLIAARARRRRP